MFGGYVAARVGVRVRARDERAGRRRRLALRATSGAEAQRGDALGRSAARRRRARRSEHHRGRCIRDLARRGGRARRGPTCSLRGVSSRARPAGAARQRVRGIAGGDEPEALGGDSAYRGAGETATRARQHRGQGDGGTARDPAGRRRGGCRKACRDRRAPHPADPQRGRNPAHHALCLRGADAARCALGTLRPTVAVETSNLAAAKA